MAAICMATTQSSSSVRQPRGGSLRRRRKSSKNAGVARPFGKRNIVAKLRQGDVLIGQRQSVAEAVRTIGVTEHCGVLAETRPDSRCWLFDPCGTCHPFSSSHQFLLCERERVKKGLHRGLAEAPAAVIGRCSL